MKTIITKIKNVFTEKKRLKKENQWLQQENERLWNDIYEIVCLPKTRKSEFKKAIYKVNFSINRLRSSCLNSQIRFSVKVDPSHFKGFSNHTDIS